MEKQYRLARREDFNKIYRYGKSAANHQFVLYYYPQTELGHFRLGISASKKIGNAVVRNSVRRRLKEIVRMNADRFPGNFDYIVIVRKPAADMEYAELEKSLLHVFRKAGLLGKK
ncbi:ribonuclease P [Gordoniibacillus kamchatkensis]|uniref:Ribonuclease P protein component n=1 Tax=Gordoniibacillus kamchatkensis TaxID=1590651 RepID=A0ABR5AEY7_9BACL|nr:ribonuclease P protein component [Paenibacillus sp. VKM B-2647]KIL39628.1 ribonuclease P [Paenibacillus sp. VKM B-2647]